MLAIRDRTKIIAKIGASSPLGEVASTEFTDISPFLNQSFDGKSQIVFFVPVGWNYRVDTLVSQAGNVTLEDWTEYILTI